MSSAQLIPPSQVVLHDAEIEEAVAEFRSILQSGSLTNAERTSLFETELAAQFRVAHAVATSSGTSALEIIIRALELAGHTVLVPSNTNFATGIAVVNGGATLRFYDSGLYPSLDSILNSIDRSTKAIVVVHIGGHIWPEIEILRQYCERNALWLIEDAAHAHGSRLAGRQPGGFGVAAALSFYESKVLTTAEGGAVLTNDTALAELARSFRTQGFESGTDLHVRRGNTWRMSEIEAVLGTIQLRSLESDSSYRTAILRRYRECAVVEHLTFPALRNDEQLSGYKCIALLDDPRLREPLRRRLLDDGIELDREVYSVPLHKQPVFAEFARRGEFRNADDFARRHICLPMWRTIDNSVVYIVSDALQRWVG